VYVRLFAGSGPRWQVSVEGGQEPLWSRDGRELFFRREDDMMAADVRLRPSFEAETPRRLFTGRFVQGPWITAYDVTADGKRFLMTSLTEDGGQPPQVIVALNWNATIAGGRRR
jgi:hypothetical protein